MTKIHCDLTNCEYCRKDGVTDYICTSDEIELIDEQCITFGSHVDISPEYREVFYKHLVSKADGHECKQQFENGKRYELLGFVWFTDQDDRWGIDEIVFTEQKSGLGCKGGMITEDHKEKIQEFIDQVAPVLSLPDATFDDIYG